MIMATFTGAPIGGFLCGQLAGVLLPTFGWPSVFLVGGVVPLLMVVALALWLPESPRFLAAKANLSPRQAALLQRLDIAPGRRRGQRSTSPTATRSRCCSARAMRCRPCCCG